MLNSLSTPVNISYQMLCIYIAKGCTWRMYLLLLNSPQLVIYLFSNERPVSRWVELGTDYHVAFLLLLHLLHVSVEISEVQSYKLKIRATNFYCVIEIQLKFLRCFLFLSTWSLTYRILQKINVDDLISNLWLSPVIALAAIYSSKVSVFSCWHLQVLTKCHLHLKQWIQLIYFPERIFRGNTLKTVLF